MYYILTTGPNSFIEVQDNNEIVISSNYNKATQYKTAGDAMRAAARVNSILGVHSVKFISVAC